MRGAGRPRLFASFSPLKRGTGTPQQRSTAAGNRHAAVPLALALELVAAGRVAQVRARVRGVATEVRVATDAVRVYKATSISETPSSGL